MTEAHRHAPITTLEDLDALDADEAVAGYREARAGDPEPGLNRSRSYHHGWRMRMHDMNEIETPAEHADLVRRHMERERERRMWKWKTP